MAQPDSIHVTTPTQVAAARAEIIDKVFGASGLSTTIPASTLVRGRGLRDEAVVVCQGHINDVESAGMGKLCDSLVAAGQQRIEARNWYRRHGRIHDR